MVRGVLIVVGMLLCAGLARADEPPAPAEAPPAAEAAPAAEPVAEVPSETPAEAPPEPPPPPAPPPLQAYAPIRPARPQAMTAAPAIRFDDDPTRFVVGQVWTLKAPAAGSILVRIGRIDELSGRTVVSVTVQGVPCPEGLGCETTTIPHMPFDRATLTASVDHVIAQSVPSDDAFNQGYRYWRDNGRGAAWTQNPADAAAMTLAAIPRRAPGAPNIAPPAPPPPPPEPPPPEPPPPAEPAAEPAPAEQAAPSPELAP